MEREIERKEKKKKEREEKGERRGKDGNGGFRSESSSDRLYSRVRGRIPIILLLCICMYAFVCVLVE